tara:strand:- start:437 stop:784 length:348 start_codon:yes stop_codon:yes gene_type:complete
MFAVKIFNDKIRKNNILNKTIKNISDFLKKDMSRDVNIILDNNSIEMVSGNLDINNGEVIAELMFKKVITIKSSDLNDREKLDEYIKEIKHFCKQAAIIEDVEYTPIYLRKLKKE